MDPETTLPGQEPKRQGAYGTLLGILLILAIIVVGALYVWGERISRTQTDVELEVPPTR